MQSLPVSSSLIQTAAYDESAQSLLITFTSGAKWAYGDASQPFTATDMADFLGAPSQGAYFLNSIKGTFPERRA